MVLFLLVLYLQVFLVLPYVHPPAASSYGPGNIVAASLWKSDRGALRAPRKLEQYADWLQRQLHGAPVRDLRVVVSVSQVILQTPLRLRLH